MNKTALYFLIGLMTLGPLTQGVSAAPADDDDTGSNWYQRHREGWWWGNEPVVKKPVPPPKPPEQKPAAPDAKAPPTPKKDQTEAFSAAWLRENLPRLIDKAIDDPTQENVAAYLYAQRALLDKGQNFEKAARLAIATDPMLDENNRVPIASFARAVADKRNTDGINEGVRYLAQKAGLWVFFDSTCTYCQPQVDIVQRLAKQVGFNASYFSLDGKTVPGLPANQVLRNDGAAQAVGVTMTPTTVLVVPPNGFYIVSQGLMDERDLRERLVMAAEAQNLLPKDILAKVRVFDRGVLSTKDLNSGASQDPSVLVRQMRQKLKGAYSNEQPTP